MKPYLETFARKRSWVSDDDGLCSARSEQKQSENQVKRRFRFASHTAPLYAFLRHRDTSHLEGRICQGFFAHLLETKNTLSRADQEKGPPSHILVGSLQNFYSKNMIGAHALKRGGEAILSFERHLPEAEAAMEDPPISAIRAPFDLAFGRQNNRENGLATVAKMHSRRTEGRMVEVLRPFALAGGGKRHH